MRQPTNNMAPAARRDRGSGRVAARGPGYVWLTSLALVLTGA